MKSFSRGRVHGQETKTRTCLLSKMMVPSQVPEKDSEIQNLVKDEDVVVIRRVKGLQSNFLHWLHERIM